ncbi:class I SAM-dependent methyltransferase [Bradyrhizobium sp. ORS 375]|uniref:class I SAM-dependent methyltransferase n=1 Tax=Bradyrhizobium sp. (strain ORS 375) TaxID=566679 RepID=UPI000555E773|nr:class I SAM-dependent methyltransferase [Bradyrhizobium sp. ORS 375]
MGDQARTKEEQYEELFQVQAEHGTARFGIMANESWSRDPRRTFFTLARYKFVSKMLEGRKRVLEVGCADAFGTRLVQQTVAHVTATDFDPVFIQDAKERMNEHWPMDLIVHDMLAGPMLQSFDAVYALDVLEHIEPSQEKHFLRNSVSSLEPHGVAIFGMPSLESQRYASWQSKKGHVNCKSAPDFRRVMEEHFHSVFIFSMNDEIVHTGYHKMAHYIIAVCAQLKTDQ